MRFGRWNLWLRNRTWYGSLTKSTVRVKGFIAPAFPTKVLLPCFSHSIPTTGTMCFTSGHQTVKIELVTASLTGRHGQFSKLNCFLATTNARMLVYLSTHSLSNPCGVVPSTVILPMSSSKVIGSSSSAYFANSLRC
jgi:hypothetical protein